MTEVTLRVSTKHFSTSLGQFLYPESIYFVKFKYRLIPPGGTPSSIWLEEQASIMGLDPGGYPVYEVTLELEDSSEYEITTKAQLNVDGTLYTDLSESIILNTGTLEQYYILEYTIYKEGLKPAPPIQGATFYLTNTSTSDVIEKVSRHDGLVYFYNIPEGSYTYEVVAAGYATVAGSINVPSGTQSGSIYLEEYVSE